jgi:hypothetical protein
MASETIPAIFLGWEDVSFANAEILLTRAVVCQHVGSLKTAASQKPVPMDAGLSERLLDWRGRCPYNQQTDYVFASAEKNGSQPLVALKRDVEAHQTRREAGWNPEARSLACFPPLVCNSPQGEW